MVSQQSIDNYLRIMNERYAQFKKDLDALIHAIAAGEANAKLKAAERTLNSADDLVRNIATDDCPHWLRVIHQILGRRGKQMADPVASQAILLDLLNNYVSISPIAWSGDEGNYAIDFDAIFAECREASTVPKLFEDILGLVRQIAESGEIENIKAIEALKTLIATLKKNAHGSYAGMSAVHDLIGQICTESMLNELETYPAIGSVVKTLRAKKDEVREALQFLKDSFRDAVNRRVDDKIKQIERIYKPALDSPSQLVISDDHAPAGQE
jgi:hypothetical protein